MRSGKQLLPTHLWLISRLGLSEGGVHIATWQNKLIWLLLFIHQFFSYTVFKKYLSMYYNYVPRTNKVALNEPS